MRKRAEPILLDNGDVLVPMSDGDTIRVTPAEESYSYWQRRAREPAGGLTAWQLLAVLLAVGFIVWWVLNLAHAGLV